MKNPFPGLNPYLEMHWSDVHVRLLTGIADQLSEQLPADLVVRAEEHLVVDADDGTRSYRADVAVEESWKAGVAPGWTPNESRGETVVAEPTVVELEPEVHRWLEIRDRGGRIITVIEVLSPANKREGQGRESYLTKQRDYLASSANLVEIDLLRGGRWSVAVPWAYFPETALGNSVVCVSRAVRRGRPEIYSFPLRQALPAFRVPLRPTERDVLLELQPLIDRCYQTGRYWLLDYRRDPEPPVALEDVPWVDERLRAAGLRPVS